VLDAAALSLLMSIWTALFALSLS